MSEYVPRLADRWLADDLHSIGAVLVEGVKGCGKTETAREFAASEVLLDQVFDASQVLSVNPAVILDGPTPRLIDEWQREPRVWDFVRRAVDERRAPGQFVLTGSATPRDDVPRHSGAGRFARLRMRPLTLFELGYSSGAVSVAALLQGRKCPSMTCDVSVPEYAKCLTVGGWPALIGADQARAQRYLDSYIDNLIEVDVPLVSGTRRDPRRIRRFLLAFAQLSAHPARMSTLVARAGEADDQIPSGASAVGVSRWAAQPYLDALERLMVVDDIPAWSPRLRSRARLVEIPKRHLVDPSLGAALMRCDAERLLNDIETFGFLFESMVARDLRNYGRCADADIYHYREAGGRREVDLILECRDGRWCGFEVKLGGTDAIDKAARSLLELSATEVREPPSALAVITAGPYCFTRPDGVHQIPLACLGP